MAKIGWRRTLPAVALLAATTVHPATLAQAQEPVRSPPAASQPDLPVGKLSDDVTPVAYRLDLTVDPAKEAFSGAVEIDVTLKRPTDRIVIHGRDLAMRRAVARVGARTVMGTWTQPDPTGVGFLSFAQPLPAGKATLSFVYDAPFYDGPSGMFRVKVGDAWYSWTQFQSIDARAAFPSFDEPGFKTPFTVTLRTPPGLTAVSNAPELSVTKEGQQEVHRFAQTLPLPTYLVAMMVGPFAVAKGEVAPTAQRAQALPLRVVSTRPNADRLSYALQGSKEIVALLEDYFGDGFPYPKLDQITSPIMPGAMENAGADLYQDNIIVLDANAPVPQKRRFGMVVSHELAHQWFGDLVTPKWWDDIWLNESFANWMGFRIGDVWRPDLNLKSGALAEGFAAMDADALVAGRPIRQEITANSQIDAAFDSITYGKGSHVVSMIAGFMGDDKFKAGVRAYMAKHRNGNATSDDFFAAMAEAAHDPRIVPAMRGFVDQQGVPLLTFAGKNGRYAVTQGRYAQLGAKPAEARWTIPACVRRGEAKSCQLIDGQQAEIVLDGKGPLVPNVGGTGYYRFELPRKDWDALIRGAGSLPGGEALALADSLVASFQAGRGDAGQIAELARRLASHPDSYAADAGGEAYAWLNRAELVDEKALPAYRAFADSIYAPVLKDLDFDPRVGAHARDDAERQQRRAVMVERLAGRDKDLDEKLEKAVTAWLAGDAASLDPAWYAEAFEVHVDKGGLPAVKVLVDRALASEDQLLRPAALTAVGRSGKADIAKWLLEDLKDERLRPTEKRTLLRDVMQRGATREYGYGWLRTNLDSLIQGGGIFFASRLPQLLNGFCSVAKADEIARDLRPRLAGQSGELELERTIERVRACGTLKDARRTEVSRVVMGLRPVR